MSLFCVRASAFVLMTLLATMWCIAKSHADTANDGTRAYTTSLDVLGQDTVELYARERGKGRPILLLHGLAASSYSWRKIIPKLARHHRVIALDLKGFGHSQKPFDLRYAPGDHARLVEAFIKKRGLNDVTIVGHSFGGAVALITTLRLNRKEKGRIRDLVLIAAPAYRQPKTEFVEFLHAPLLPYLALAIVPPELATWLSLTQAERNISTHADVRAYARPYYDPAARHALITTTRQIMPHDIDTLTSLYPTIRQRALVVWCDNDKTVPLTKGQRLVQTLPRARLKVLQGCGHAVPDERPRELSRILNRFIHRH